MPNLALTFSVFQHILIVTVVVIASCGGRLGLGIVREDGGRRALIVGHRRAVSKVDTRS